MGTRLLTMFVALFVIVATTTGVPLPPLAQIAKGTWTDPPFIRVLRESLLYNNIEESGNTETVEEHLPDVMFMAEGPPATGVSNPGSPVLLSDLRVMRSGSARWRLRVHVLDLDLRAVPLRVERRDLRLRARCSPLLEDSAAPGHSGSGDLELRLRDVVAAGVLFLELHDTANGTKVLRATALELNLRAEGAQLEVRTPSGHHLLEEQPLHASPAAVFLPATWARIREVLRKRLDAALAAHPATDFLREDDEDKRTAAEVAEAMILAQRVAAAADDALVAVSEKIAAMGRVGIVGSQGENFWWSGPTTIQRSGDVLLAPFISDEDHDGGYADKMVDLDIEDYEKTEEAVSSGDMGDITDGEIAVSEGALIARCSLRASGMTVGQGGVGMTMADAELTLLALLDPLVCAARLLELRADGIKGPVRTLAETTPRGRTEQEALLLLPALPGAAKVTAEAAEGVMGAALRALPCSSLRTFVTR